METLFDLPETLSPKLAWMRKHGVELKYTPPMPARYTATTGPQSGVASTEVEALSSLASSLGIPMWDEESIKTTSHE